MTKVVGLKSSILLGGSSYIDMYEVIYHDT